MITITFNKEGSHCEINGGFQQRNPSILKLFTDVWKTLTAEELAKEKTFSVYTEDCPYTLPTPNTFSIAGRKEDGARCFPCFVFDKWEEAKINDYEDLVQNLRTSGETLPTIPKAFWIGAATHPTRLKLIELGKQHPEELETRLFNWDPAVTQNAYVSLPEHTCYKYLIDMQGGGYSGRLKMLLHSRRLLFVQDRPFWDWATSRLEPWVHYVPVKEDLSDLVEKIHWADSNPEQVARIISNCGEYALQWCTRESAHQQIRDLIKTL